MFVMSLTNRNLTISWYCKVLLIPMRAFQVHICITKNILLNDLELNWGMLEIVFSVNSPT